MCIELKTKRSRRVSVASTVLCSGQALLASRGCGHADHPCPGAGYVAGGPPVTLISKQRNYRVRENLFIFSRNENQYFPSASWVREQLDQIIIFRTTRSH